MNNAIDIKNTSGINAGIKLRNYIINSIKNQNLKPGDPLHSTQELSSMFKISLGTAQKVLKQLGDEGLLLREPRKKTLVATQSLEKYDFDRIGITTFSQNPFYSDILELISEKCLQQDVKLYIGQGSKELDFIDKMVEREVSTFIHFPYDLRKEATTWEKLKSKNISTVVINDFWNNGGPFNSVQTNEEYGIREMMSHLIALGHRKIMFLDENSKEPRDRARCVYEQVMRSHGFGFNTDLVKYILDYNTLTITSEIVDDLLQLGTAVICTYDCFAIQILDQLNARGLEPGKDFSVAGFDGIHQAEKHGLTTVVQPIQKLIDTAFKLLQNTDKVEKLIINPKCVFKRSTGRLKNI